MPKSATTLKGKPLKTNVTPSLATAIVDENDESVIHTSKPFFRLANEVNMNERRLKYFFYFKISNFYNLHKNYFR